MSQNFTKKCSKTAVPIVAKSSKFLLHHNKGFNNIYITEVAQRLAVVGRTNGVQTAGVRAGGVRVAPIWAGGVHLSGAPAGGLIGEAQNTADAIQGKRNRTSSSSPKRLIFSQTNFAKLTRSDILSETHFSAAADSTTNHREQSKSGYQDD